MQYVKKECHKGTISVFEDPKTEIIIKAGGKWKDLELLPDHLIVDCGADVSKNIEIYGFTPHIDLEKKYNHKSITITWPDFGTPNLDLAFWGDLISVLRKKKKDVIVCCKGGHGRTGTCLSILAFYMDIPEAQDDPVAFVRSKYCKEAVETENQVSYIEKMCNISIPNTHGSDWSGDKKKSNMKKEDYTDPFWYKEDITYPGYYKNGWSWE